MLWVLGLPFGAPLVLAAVHPLVRWLPQEWTIDERGIAGRGRARTRVPRASIAAWQVEEPVGLPTHVRIVVRRAPAWRHPPLAMLVPLGLRADVEARLAG